MGAGPQPGVARQYRHIWHGGRRPSKGERHRVYELRDYQVSFVGRIRGAFGRRKQRVLAVSPTGSGKTVMFAHVVSGAASKGNRCVIAAHRTEIVDQISDALTEMGVPHGRIQGQHKRSDEPVQVAMIQTLANRIDDLEAPELIVFDEAHHAVAKTYTSILKQWPRSKVLGVTATPLRLDGKGLGRVFDAMVVGPTTNELIKAEWLASYDYLAPPMKADLTGISVIGGDYAEDELAEAMDKAAITGDAFEHYVEHLQGRSAIVFCVRVSHAENVAKYFADRGIRAASVDGEMNRHDRRDRILGIGNGKYQILTSCSLISEGLDVPSVGGVILLRPTMSLALHLQQIGRALRPKAGGASAVVLDHVDNIKKHGLPDAPHIWTLEDQPKRHGTEIECPVEGCGLVFINRPNWRAQECAKLEETGQHCPFPTDPDCVLLPLETIETDGVQAPVVVDGQLQRVSSQPAWAKGCDLLTTNSAELKALIGHADTIEKLHEIRRARNYKPGWIRYVLRDRGGVP